MPLSEKVPPSSLPQAPDGLWAKESGEADDDGRKRQGQKLVPTLVPLAELPSSGTASQDDFPTLRQLARHLSRHSGPVATLRDLPAEEQFPPMVAAQARGRAAGQMPYATGLTAGTTWSRDQHGASLDPTRKLHYRPMAALFHGCQQQRVSDVTSSPSPSAYGLA